MMMNMDVVAPHTDRVWCRKLNDEIDTYKTKINTYIEAALKDRKKPGLKTERDMKCTLEFIRDKMIKRLRTLLYEHNLADPDEQINENMKK
eukprot:scaffold127845_cov84-Attheya_sp.AAC.2